MPRATRRDASDEGSLKENTPVKVKPERSAKGSNLQNTPERSSKRKGRAVIEEDEEDEEAGATQPGAGPSGASQEQGGGDIEDDTNREVDDDDVEGEGSPKGRKRARKNTVGESAPVKGETVQHRTARETLPRDPKDG